MATKKKTIEDTGVLPINFFDDVVSVQSQPIVSYEYKYGDKTVEVKCKPYLSYEERQQFVEAIWGVFFSVDTAGHYDYRPYLLDELIRYMTIRLYCVNVPFDKKKDMSSYEQFLLTTDFYDVLCKHLVDHSRLVDATYAYIEYKIDTLNTSAKSIVDNSIVKFANKATEFLDTLGALDHEQLKGLLQSLGGLFKSGETPEES